VLYIRQRHDWDCGIAAIAMAADVPYEQVLADLVPDGTERGLNELHVHDWLHRNGWAWQQISRNRPSCGKYVPRDPWPPAPFAPSHIAQVEATQGWHFTVMDGSGRVLDPWNEARDTLEHSDYGQVTWVLGLFKVA